MNMNSLFSLSSLDLRDDDERVRARTQRFVMTTPKRQECVTHLATVSA